jgi:hypothetical protein
MITNLDPEKITRLLTQSARQLDPRTLSALSNARQTALGRQSLHVPVFAFNTGHGMHRLIPGPIRLWMVAALLVATVIIGMGYWNHLQEQQIDETDLAILTDDMTIDVFVN